MAKPERFLFICNNERPQGHPRGSCTLKGGREVAARFYEVMEERGLTGTVGLVPTGCLGPCFEGPVAALFPDDVWYCNITPADVEEIVDKHFIGGEPVKRLLLRDEDWG
ncbi:MAG TPA: (2Fe-2S) ferredoxin domain-containing protein [Deltaproteobacteria bacterium]|nr:(2Fe-2S) ferredoxin domain-containing protein [Deltaproteobacteria bacterium]